MEEFRESAEMVKEPGPEEEKQFREVKFGEKVKSIREEKGLTQQTLAEKLYVTRQAVSRWECGARQPDLLTAKKIARILDVSLDELLSGEELREDIEKKPVSTGPAEHVIQTALYAGVAMVYLLLCLFSVYAVFGPNRPSSDTPAGRITLLYAASDLVRVFYFTAAAVGLLLSVRNKLTAKAAGIIMCVPYLSEAFLFLFTYAEIQKNHNGYIGFAGWVTDFFLPLVFAGCIILYFYQKEQKIPFGVILGICLLTAGALVYVYRYKFRYFTDTGFATMTMGMAGKLGMAGLLAYQAYVWKKRRKAGILLPAPYPVD